MGSKPSPAVYQTEEFQSFLKGLRPGDKFKKWIEEMKDKLKENMLAGDSIPKKKIPDYYIREYHVNNLYRFSHPEGYRFCYTLVRIPELGVICPVILDFLSHPEYEKRFGYRTT